MNLERTFKTAIETGEVWFGVNECVKAIDSGKAKLLVVSRNCPEPKLRRMGVKVYNFKGSNVELGTLCGKPFAISAFAVLDEGDSNILSMA